MTGSLFARINTMIPELDDPQQLLNTVGGFWSTVYADRDLVASILYARGRLDQQTHLDLLELLACTSLTKIPVFHAKYWQAVTIRESQLNTVKADYATFNGDYTFSSNLAFDTLPPHALFVWAMPADLADVRIVTNRITESSWTQVCGMDFFLYKRAIWFRHNPFTSELVHKREIFVDNVVVDRECDLWLHRGLWDRKNIYQQFGYVYGLELPSSPAYKRLTRTMYSGMTEGTTVRSVEEVLAIACDVQLAAADDEVVQSIFTDQRGICIVTDQRVYRFHTGSSVLVSVGDVLKAGQTLTDTVRYYEFNRGQVPSDLLSLAVDKTFLATGYLSDLVFDNKTVSLVVDTEDSSGYTKVSFAIGGQASDVTRFWDDIHVKGVIAQQTLAMLMDQRPIAARTTQPGRLALPLTVNPLQFLLQNIFRNNVFVIKLRSQYFGPNALGITITKLLRRLLAPHVTCILLVQLTNDADEIIMASAGNEAAPGYTEELNVYLGELCTDTLDGSTMLTETVRCYQVSGPVV